MIELLDSDRSITNPLNGKSYQFVPLNELIPTEAQLERIALICNEPLVFDWLFAEMFPDGTYPVSSARDWISWATEGWENQTHFVFATLDSDGLVVAACDIKSAQLENAEIGYWASSNHRGVMTNSVSRMLEVARRGGFRGFFAEPHRENLKSQSLLKRVGFSQVEEPAGRLGHLLFRG